jgi:DNA-binding SARP family transcriptional activator
MTAQTASVSSGSPSKDHLPPPPMQPMSLLEIRLLGRFAVAVNGEEVAHHRWERQSAKSLIKLLALSRTHTLHREQIMDVLWPDQDATAGSNGLNKAIHAARRALEPGLRKGAQSRFILTPRNQVRLAAPGALHVDVHAFEDAANRAQRQRHAGSAREALRLYGGTLLQDDLYEPWANTPRELMGQLFRATCMSAGRWSADEGESTQGIEILQRLLLDDAADEAAHRLMMQLYANSSHRCIETGAPVVRIRVISSPPAQPIQHRWCRGSVRRPVPASRCRAR